ncbi:MAG TPA: radical SAM protein, partial [Pseudonocardia sp.]|nr:radical SAM protein [Pseudonocardia sp.]
MTATELGLPAVRRAATRDPARPADPRLVDRYGRVATDLRISLTDRCNLRCTYCMPAEGLDWMPREEQLTDDELVRLIGIAVRELGVHELRFTGGEPLLRKGLEDVIAASAALSPRPD